jgi:mevalonate kinase
MLAQAVRRLVRHLAADERDVLDQIDVEVDADLPPGAGLGSSAAFSVAVARSLGSRSGASDDAIASATDSAERLFHHNASGVDAAAALHGGVGVYRQGDGWRELSVPRPVTLCVGLSGRSRRTRDQVIKVRKRYNKSARTGAVLDEIGLLTVEAFRALELGQIEQLGSAMDAAQRCLVDLGLSCPETETLVDLAIKAGASGAKMSGGGGGGAVVALAADPHLASPIIEAWARAGFSGFTATVPHVHHA